MAGSLNRVTLIGNLGADPEAKSLQNGGEVVNLRIATSESWKDKSTGERQERTQWHQIVVWNEPLQKVIKSYCKKGSKVFIEGQLETRKWQDQSGNDRYSTEVVLRPFNSTLVLLDRKDDSGGQRGGDYDQSGPDDDSDQTYGFGTGGGGQSARPRQRPQPAAFDTDLDDDVPFATVDNSLDMRLERRCT
jgi:single-strand DNA-binding protein